MIQEIQENDLLLRKLYKAGLVSPRVFFYRNLWVEYDLQEKMGNTKMDCLHNTAEKFGVCYMTVYRALKVMNTDL